MTAGVYWWEKFERRTLRGRRWFFRFVAPNGEKMWSSEPYSSAKARDDGIAVGRREASFSKVRDAE
jgi:uncharacterized protein YegP (UPF0339 family)